MTLKTLFTSAALGLSILAGHPTMALADHGRHGWRGDIRHFRDHDQHRWNTGHWVHGRHGGHLGWWWVVGGLWYFYSAPVYPYPDPYVPPVVVGQQPPVIIQQPTPTPPPAQPPTAQDRYWYYCGPADAYYPYVATCPSGWKKVPATPPDVPAQ